MTDPRESMENTNNDLNTNNLLTKFLEEFKSTKNSLNTLE
jgi:hypothetical protein